MHSQSSDSLEDSRLLNQQKPHGGWFSDASSTSATESFPSYSRPPQSSLSRSPSSSTLLSIYLPASIPPHHPRTPPLYCGLSAIMTAEQLHIQGNIRVQGEVGWFCSPVGGCRVAKTRLISEQTRSGARIKTGNQTPRLRNRLRGVSSFLVSPRQIPSLSDIWIS